jgi:uncharacterized membrane protein YfbV (UPF0208 family)
VKPLLTILALVLSLPVLIVAAIALGPAILVILFIAGIAVVIVGTMWLGGRAVTR